MDSSLFVNIPLFAGLPPAGREEHARACRGAEPIFWVGFLAVFVLTSQNCAAQKNGIRGDLDYQLNLKAQDEYAAAREVRWASAERRARAQNALPDSAG